MFYTTLRSFHAHGPLQCELDQLLSYLGKSKVDDKPLSLATILEANGIVDAIWALRTVEGIDDLVLLFSIRCLREHFQYMLTDNRSLDALDVAELYAVG